MIKTDKELLDNIIGDSMRNYIMPVILCILIGFYYQIYVKSISR